jgi:hypothetical protein
VVAVNRIVPRYLHGPSKQRSSFGNIASPALVALELTPRLKSDIRSGIILHCRSVAEASRANVAVAEVDIRQ